LKLDGARLKSIVGDIIRNRTVQTIKTAIWSKIICYNLIWTIREATDFEPKPINFTSNLNIFPRAINLPIQANFLWDNSAFSRLDHRSLFLVFGQKFYKKEFPIM